MTKQCAICKKGGLMVWRRVKLRGKFNPTVKRKQKPNLQWLSVPVDVKKTRYRQFAGKRILACAKCIKALAKRK